MGDLTLLIPDWLYNVMGAWGLFTALVGIVANSLVILLFILSKKVRIGIRH